MKRIDTIKEIYTLKDRFFEVSVEPFFNPLYLVEIKEIKYPNRKFFKGEISKFVLLRCIDNFETVDDMILDVFKDKFTFEELTKEKNEKLKKFFGKESWQTK